MSKQKIKVVEAAVVFNKFSPSGKAARCVVKIKDDVLRPTLFIEPTDAGVYQVIQKASTGPENAVTEDIEKAVSDYLAQYGPACSEVPKKAKPDEKRPDIDEVTDGQVKTGGGIKK